MRNIEKDGTITIEVKARHRPRSWSRQNDSRSKWHLVDGYFAYAGTDWQGQNNEFVSVVAACGKHTILDRDEVSIVVGKPEGAFCPNCERKWRKETA